MPSGTYERKKKLTLTEAEKKPDGTKTVEVDKPEPESFEQAVEKTHAEFEEAVEEKKPRKKYSRRKKSEVEAAEVDAQTRKVNELKESFMPLGGICVQLMCQYLPDPIPPTPLEIDLAGKATAQLIEKYAPKILGYEAEVSLAVVLTIIIVPRLGLFKKTNEPLKNTPEEQAEVEYHLKEAERLKKEREEKEEKSSDI